MYTRWLDRSLSHEIASEVLVFQDGAEQLGFVTLAVKGGRAAIVLLGVHHSARGKGLGKALVRTARCRASALGVSEIQVVTQGDNAAACALYERSGFALENTEHVFHFWIA